jgi:putative flippase GtrA
MSSTIVTRIRGSWRLIAKEVAAFGLVGAISFVIDIGLFNLFLHHGQGPIEAKTFSTAVSTTFAYFGNRHLSFSHRARTSLGREAGFFFLINLITLVGSLLILGVFAYPLHYKYDQVVMNVVNLVTIGIGTVIRFDAYKRFVFLHPDKVHFVHPDSDPGVADTDDGAQDAVA